MKQYLELLDKILAEGAQKTDRTGTGTISIFGHQMRFDLQKGFPLLTTKKLHLKSILYELLWFLQGDTNVHYLQEHGVRIWDEWADEKGDLGHIYGYQWRSWPRPDGTHLDQIAQVVRDIRNTPDSRRLIVSAWNAGDIENMALAPCHALFQFYVVDGKLSCQLYQRSADTFLGVPFNIASYALLTLMMGAGLRVAARGVYTYLGRYPYLFKSYRTGEVATDPEPRELSQMHLNPEVKDIFGFRYEDFQLSNYNPHPHIKGDISV